jgi:hypothetical protein
MISGKGCGRRGLRPNFEVLSQHMPEGLRKTMKNLNQENRSATTDGTSQTAVIIKV